MKVPGKSRQVKAGLLIVALAACCAVYACGPRYAAEVSQEQVVPEDSEMGIYELVVRNMAAGETEGETIFIAFGDSWPNRVDPPPALLKSLSDMDVSFEAISRQSRRAQPNALVYMAHPIEWIAETEAIVSVTRVRFGVGASDGFTSRVKWTDGKWKIVKTSCFWRT